MAFDKTLPIEGALAPTYNNIMREDKAALEAALNAYMYFATGGTQTGQPRQGSARPYFQDTAPTARLDGDHFDSTDLGTPWIDSNADPDNQYNILTAADGAGTNTWTPISTEIIAVLLAANRIFAGTLKSTGNFTVGADKLTVAAATGNTAVAGTLGVTGVATVTGGLADGSALAAATESGDGDRTIVDLNYAKTGDTVQHDTEGGYSNCDVNGTKTKVYTKYFTGTLDADDSTNVTHGEDVDKILSITAMCWDDTTSAYRVNRDNSADSDKGFTVRCSASNVILDDVGAHLQGNNYRIRVDYIL